MRSKSKMVRSQKHVKRRHRLAKLYITLVCTIVAVFLGMTGIIAMSFNFTAEAVETSTVPQPVKTPEITNSETIKEPVEKPEVVKTTVAVLGVDKDGLRTDVTFVVNFDSETKEIHVVSVPRDTRVTMPNEMIKEMEERDREDFIPMKTGVRGQCKLTEIHAYAGDGYRNQYSVMMLEDLLGIKIDYYVKVDISGFKAIVDAIGGVDMEIKDRLYYVDPYQNLTIDIRPGFQHLDGAKAEGVVRFREGYVQKDLKRIEVQQDFMKEFMNKIMSTETLIGNLPKLVNIAFEYVETDISISDALKYVKYINDISMDKVTMETIPGEGGAYFDIDKEGTKELVDRVFYDIEPEKPLDSDEESETDTKTQSISEADSTHLNLEVANGGIIQGMAGRTKTVLEADGYNVSFVSTYNGEQQNATRIIVKEEGIGLDLIPYFENASVEVDPKLISSGTDIKIIIGLDEK